MADIDYDVQEDCNDSDNTDQLKLLLKKDRSIVGYLKKDWSWKQAAQW